MSKLAFVTATLGLLLSTTTGCSEQAPVNNQPTSAQQEASPAQSLLGLPVYSSDNQKVGQVKSISLGGNGTVTGLEAEIEGFLGLGASSVRFTPGQFQHEGDRIVLAKTAGQVRGVPDESYKSFDRSRSGAPPAP